MLLPALLNLLIIGIPYFTVLIFKLRIKYCQKNNRSDIKIANKNNKIFDQSQLEPQHLDNSQSFIQQHEDEKKQSIVINKQNDQIIVQDQSPILQNQEDQKQQQSKQNQNEKKFNNQEVHAINQNQNNLQNSVITNNSHYKTTDNELNQIEQPVKINEQNQIYSILESYKYQNLINLFLLLSCLTFIQSLVSRYYVMKTKQKILFPAIFYLSLLNTIISFFYYNIGYGCLMKFLQKHTPVDLEILKYLLILYGLIMTFPIYSGLDDYIQYDSLNLLLAIILMIPLQISVTKKKIFENYPIYFS